MRTPSQPPTAFHLLIPSSLCCSAPYPPPSFHSASITLLSLYPSLSLYTAARSLSHPALPFTPLTSSAYTYPYHYLLHCRHLAQQLGITSPHLSAVQSCDTEPQSLDVPALSKKVRYSCEPWPPLKSPEKQIRVRKLSGCRAALQIQGVEVLKRRYPNKSYNQNRNRQTRGCIQISARWGFMLLIYIPERGRLTLRTLVSFCSLPLFTCLCNGHYVLSRHAVYCYFQDELGYSEMPSIDMWVVLYFFYDRMALLVHQCGARQNIWTTMVMDWHENVYRHCCPEDTGFCDSLSLPLEPPWGWHSHKRANFMSLSR